MLVMVRYGDEETELDIVEDYCVDYLILTNRITAYAQSDRWVTVAGAAKPVPVSEQAPALPAHPL